MKYLITGDLKDVCKKCKLSVEATGIIIGINCGTCPIRTAVEVKERETGYWWCPQCKEAVEEPLEKLAKRKGVKAIWLGQKCIDSSREIYKHIILITSLYSHAVSIHEDTSYEAESKARQYLNGLPDKEV